MAYGIRCEHCGWQETVHDYKGDVDADELNIVYAGRTNSLETCPGYMPEDPEAEWAAFRADPHAYPHEVVDDEGEDTADQHSCLSPGVLARLDRLH